MSTFLTYLSLLTGLPVGVLNVASRSLNAVSVCSGIEGFGLGLQQVIPTRTILYLEIEASVAAILAARMEEGLIHKAPVWSDIKSLDTEPFRGKVDILFGSPPCTPFSVAGEKLAEDDARNLWPDFARLIRGLGFPTWVFMENVSGPLFLRYYFFDIRKELREMGYTVTEGLFSAAETGAPQKRQRIFILAYRG